MRMGAMRSPIRFGEMVDVHGLAENRLRVDGQRYTQHRRTLVEVLEQATAR